MIGCCSQDGWQLLLYPALLWVLFGPLIMLGMGVWCARIPGRAPRLWSVLLPLAPVVSSSTLMVMTVRDQPTCTEDLLVYFAVYVLGITALPWLLGYGTTRATDALRTRRKASGRG
ncbi:hypothetical protein ACQEVY_25140 [Streptomyces sp. CA-288835]|uniref:hypothetical protein n=1 Tax=Streptomyces sp. CA-288835 TaxID=3240069 RepID=UPI003D8B54A4